MRNKIGEKATNQFIEAMKKGLVGDKGQAGIKRLSAGAKVTGQSVEYEVKVFGEFANYRLYGNYDKDRDVIIFTIFGKALH